MKFWPILMLSFAGVSSGFAFYHSMQNLTEDVSELKLMLVSEERIELELKFRDNEIDQIKNWMRLQEKVTEAIENDVTDWYRRPR